MNAKEILATMLWITRKWKIDTQDTTKDAPQTIIVNGKPDWSQAPSWANWLCMDWDGSWWWYEQEPFYKPKTLGWTAKGGKCDLHSHKDEIWKNTLEERPK